MPKKPDPITTYGPAYFKAIRAVARVEGRYWKAALLTSWLNGTEMQYGEKHSPLLRQLRNQLGPQWLHKFNLKEVS
jgi:hypothetical protein